MTRFLKCAMKISKEGTVIFSTIAFLIWHHNSPDGWYSWCFNFVVGFFTAYGIKSFLDKMEKLVWQHYVLKKELKRIMSLPPDPLIGQTITFDRPTKYEP